MGGPKRLRNPKPARSYQSSPTTSPMATRVILSGRLVGSRFPRGGTGGCQKRERAGRRAKATRSPFGGKPFALEAEEPSPEECFMKLPGDSRDLNQNRF